MTRPRCDETTAWQALRAYFDAHFDAHFDARVDTRGRAFDLRDAFDADPKRFERFSLQAPHVFADLSRQLWDAPTRELLIDLARQCQVESHRDAMFDGALVNVTEGRAAGHVWLREEPARDDAIAQARDAMLAYAEEVRADPRITDVVNIGIGGSDLGPKLATQALAPKGLAAKRMHFVSNVDGHALAGVLRQCRPESTLFLVASKTFTTTETMLNAASARAWFQAGGGTDMQRHFCALTASADAARGFGITRSLLFQDWVGGRYSLWSSIGLAVAIALGAAGFRDMLAGAREMDAHFRTAPLERNLPVLLALADLWHRDFHGTGSRCVAPYHNGLRRLPAYLQQLEMESNGKRVDLSGRALPFDTAPVVWGEAGTNGQHAFFQMLHQGTQVVPVEFIAVREAAHGLPGHHDALLANALAQARALMVGQLDDGGHRHFPGNRPSSFLLLQRLDPVSLGALIALYEHRVFVTGSLWGINSFDQFGVELGKVIARDIQPRLASGDALGLDGATAGLISQLRQRG